MRLAPQVLGQLGGAREALVAQATAAHAPLLAARQLVQLTPLVFLE